jgi:signal transduction histidine kinase
VTETLQPALQARGGGVEVQGHVPPILADKTRLTQVFTNLIDNAVAYTPPERAPRIAIELRADDEDAVEVTVSDNGVGIPPAMHDKVFEIFQRLPAGKRLNPQGTGAGLAIVARIVETHGGAIRVDSSEGAGTTFRIHLPRGRAA